VSGGSWRGSPCVDGHGLDYAFAVFGRLEFNMMYAMRARHQVLSRFVMAYLGMRCIEFKNHNTGIIGEKVSKGPLKCNSAC
jgi:hypothetical protein